MFSILPKGTKNDKVDSEMLFGGKYNTVSKRRNSIFIDMSIALLSVSLFTLIRFVFSPYITLYDKPFILSVIPIVISSWRSGLRAGIITTVLSAFTTYYFFYFPSGQLKTISPVDLYWFSIFIIQGFLISFLSENLHRLLLKYENTMIRLKESEAKYKLVLENTNDLIMMTDTEGYVINKSNSYDKTLGHNSNLTSNENFFSLIHSDDVLNAKVEFTNAVNGDKGLLQTVRLKHTDGHFVYFEITALPIKNNRKETYAIVLTCRNITERKKFEDEIQENLSLLSTVIEGISDAVFVKDLDGRYVLINSAGARMINKPADEIIGQRASEFFNEQTVIDIDRSEKLAIDTEKTVTYDERFVRDGKENTFLSTKSIYRDSSGNIIGFVGVSHDITERKQYEEKLEELNKRITNILQSITDAFFALNDEGKFIYLNHQAEKLLQISGERVIGKSVWDEFPEIIDSEFYKKYFRAIATQKPLIFEKRYSPLNKYFEIHAYPSKEGFSVYFSDITKRKEVEDALRENEERFRILAESVPQLIWTANPDGSKDYYNKQWYEYTGLNFEETKGWGWLKAIHPEDREASTKEWKRVLKSGKPFQSEFRIHHRNGKGYRWFLIRALPIKNINGKIIKWFGSATDIDDQKKIDERKDEFISTASHELKTPITTIKAFTQLLQRKFNSQKFPEATLYLYKMDYQINRLKTLINDLLDVSKIRAGKLEFLDREFDVDNMIQEVVEDTQPSTTHKIEVKGAVQKKIYGDRYRIGQVLNNLISNAIKYSPKADKIIVSAKSTNRQIQISIQDFGIGIPNYEQKKIFERFYRLSGTKGERFEGMGLGLHIVGEIIRRHKGKINIQSEVGKGSIFTIVLPIKKSEARRITSSRNAEKSYEKTYIGHR